MRFASIGRGSPATAAKLLAGGVAAFLLAAVLEGMASAICVVVGGVFLGMSAITLGRWPRRN